MEPVHKGLSQDPESNDRDQGPLSQTWCQEVLSVEINEEIRDGVLPLRARSSTSVRSGSTQTWSDQLDSSGSQTEG